MDERYSGYDGRSGADAASAHESPTAQSAASARALFAQLLPDADVALLVRALTEELAAGAGSSPLLAGRDQSATAAERELWRVRYQLAIGDVARTLQHSLNNPLTALLAEAQLLELEQLAPEHRRAVSRILELSRRVIGVVRRLQVTDAPLG